MINHKKLSVKYFNIIKNVRYIIDESNSDIFSLLNTNITCLKTAITKIDNKPF